MRSLFLVATIACGHPGPAHLTNAAPGLPSEPAEARPILDELNAWCAHVGGDCDVAERPGLHPNQVPAGETNGWISSHRDRLRAFGVEVVWDGRQFVSQVDDDLAVIVGGMFAVDHLGPERYDAIVARARARAPLYLGELVTHVVQPDPSYLDRRYVPSAIELVREVAPDAARIAARELVPRYQAALRQLDTKRLHRDLDALDALAR